MKEKYPVWHSSAGEIISCVEKIKVMQQNIDELRLIAQDLFEDGVLMGIDQKQLKSYLSSLMNSLSNPYINNHSSEESR